LSPEQIPIEEFDAKDAIEEILYESEVKNRSKYIVITSINYQQGGN